MPRVDSLKWMCRATLLAAMERVPQIRVWERYAACRLRVTVSAPTCNVRRSVARA
jgi:hypothetical protein